MSRNFNSTNLKAALVNFLIYEVVVFLLFGPYLASLMAKWTRFSYFWRTGDALILLGTMAGFGIVGVMVKILLNRWTPQFWARVYDHLFLVTLGAGILANLWRFTYREKGYHLGQFGWDMQTLWLIMIAVVAYSLASPRSKLVHYGRQLCLVVSPALAIITFQILSMSTFPVKNDPLPPAAVQPVVLTGGPVQKDADTPVYIFIFDGWSYERTFQDGEIHPKLKNLNQFAERAAVFHRARSMGTCTKYSLPAFLYQADAKTVWRGNQVGFQQNGQWIRPNHFTGIFNLANEARYRTFMIGFGVPFQVFVDGEIDCCRSYHTINVGQGVFGKAGIHCFSAMHYWTDPLFAKLYREHKYQLFDAQYLYLYKVMANDIEMVIGRQPSKTLAVFHYPLPHFPYIRDEKGHYTRSQLKMEPISEETGYHRNLVLMDKRLGRFVELMKEAGRFDSALVILTSDHSWRHDPQRMNKKDDEENLRHVPLLIKFPHQEKPIYVKKSWPLCRLKPFISCCIEGKHFPVFKRQLEAELACSDKYWR